MLTRFKRQLMVRGARCAGGLLLLSAPLATQAMAQGEKVYRPQMVAMAPTGIDLVDPIISLGPGLMPAVSADPDDSLFSAGREALNRNNFRDAARLFEQLRTDYPRSNFVPSAMYWEAFSRYRLGGTDNLRQARQLLQNQIDRYPNANTHNDALTLAARLDGELARRGDADAARGIAQELQNEECAEGENDVRIAALNALMNSNSERALPILKRVLERRDPCSVEMRKTALFVISQHGGDETAAILMDVVANDPDADMRGSAVFWLSQNPSPETVTLLDSLLRYSTDDAGTLAVEWDKVSSLTSIHTFEVELATERRLFGSLSEGPEPGTMEVAGEVLPLITIVAITEMNPGFWKRTSGYLDLGWTLAKANKAHTATLGAQGRYRGQKLDATATASFYEQGQDSTNVTRNSSLSLDLNRLYGTVWAWRFIGEVSQNDELGRDLRTFVGSGARRRIVRTNRMDASWSVGLDGSRERYADESESTLSAEFFAGADFAAFRLDSPQLDVTSDLRTFTSLTERGRFRVDFNVRVQYELFEDFFVALTLESEYDNKPPSETPDTKTDYTSELTVGWSW